MNLPPKAREVKAKIKNGGFQDGCGVARNRALAPSSGPVLQLNHRAINSKIQFTGMRVCVSERVRG